MMTTTFSLETRPYQINDVDAIMARLEEAQRGVVYKGETGSGKSVVLGLLAQKIVRMDRRLLLLTHRRELIGQLEEKVAALKLDYGFIRPKYQPGDRAVTIGSIDTLAARLHYMRPFLREQYAVFFDECHHIASPRWSGIWQACAEYSRIGGGTATPWRLDGAGLGTYFDISVQGPSMRFLIDNEWLSDFLIYQPPIPIDLKGVNKIGGDWNIAKLAKVMDDDLITEKVIRYWVDRGCRGRPTLVFCVTVEHAKNVAALWRKMTGLNFQAVYGEMDDDERDRLIRGMKTGEVDGITACELVSEGLDIPRVACGVFLRPTESTGLFMQQTGRTLRLDDIFEYALIVDAVGNAMKHGMPDEFRPWSLKAGAKGMERDIRKPIRCIECYRVQPAVEICIECGRRQVSSSIRGTVIHSATMPIIPDSRDLRGMSKEMLKLASEDTLLKVARTENDLKFIAYVTGRNAMWIARNSERLRRAQLEHRVQ